MAIETDKEQLKKRIETALDEIRPHLVIDGGDIKVLEITENMDVVVELLGNCQNCSLSDFTLKNGVEQVLRNRFPDVRNVVAINASEV
jgi:Fe-S cluster biogenesis protein NfuA